MEFPKLALVWDNGFDIRHSKKRWIIKIFPDNRCMALMETKNARSFDEAKLFYEKWSKSENPKKLLYENQETLLWDNYEFIESKQRINKIEE